MIDETEVAWMREFLTALAQTDSDREEVLEIVEAYKKLLKVRHAAEKVVFRPDTDYSPNSKKSELKEALLALKEEPPHGP